MFVVCLFVCMYACRHIWCHLHLEYISLKNINSIELRFLVRNSSSLTYTCAYIHTHTYTNTYLEYLLRSNPYLRTYISRLRTHSQTSSFLCNSLYFHLLLLLFTIAVAFINYFYIIYLYYIFIIVKRCNFFIIYTNVLVFFCHKSVVVCHHIYRICVCLCVCNSFLFRLNVNKSMATASERFLEFSCWMKKQLTPVQSYMHTYLHI